MGRKHEVVIPATGLKPCDIELQAIIAQNNSQSPTTTDPNNELTFAEMHAIESGSRPMKNVTRSTRAKAVEYITQSRSELVNDGDYWTTFRIEPIESEETSRGYWWAVEDVFGSLDQRICRELCLWRITQNPMIGGWDILRWVGNEITRTDCPQRLLDMVRPTQVASSTTKASE